jgi:uncharacterized membrane protein
MSTRASVNAPMKPAPSASPPAQKTSHGLRTGADRLRHVLLFELVALSIVIPCGSTLFGLHESAMGVIGIGSAITATVWNFFYNLLFDHVMLRLRATTRKTTLTRVVHTLGFEAGLQVILLPAIAAYCGLSVLASLPLTLSLAGFYLVYAFVFNLAYDWLFPLPVASAPLCEA